MWFAPHTMTFAYYGLMLQQTYYVENHASIIDTGLVMLQSQKNHSGDIATWSEWLVA